MPADTSESRPMLEQARETMRCVQDIPAAYDDTERRAQYVEEAKAEAQLAIAEELRALREAVNGSAQCIADEITKLPARIENGMRDPRG